MPEHDEPLLLDGADLPADQLNYITKKSTEVMEQIMTYLLLAGRFSGLRSPLFR